MGRLSAERRVPTRSCRLGRRLAGAFLSTTPSQEAGIRLQAGRRRERGGLENGLGDSALPRLG